MKRITITVEPGDYAAMSQLAKDNDVTVSWLIRRLMREFVERQEREGSFRFEIGHRRRTTGAGVQP